MAFARNAGFTSAIATDPADTAAGYITPTRYNLAHVVAGADVGGIPYCPTATTEVTSTKLLFNRAAGEGLVQALDTAVTDVAASSITRINNNAAVATGVKWTFTDTSSAAGFLPFQILGGAAGTTNLLSLNKVGILTCGAALAVDGEAHTLGNLSGYTVLRSVNGGAGFALAAAGGDASVGWMSISATRTNFTAANVVGWTSSTDPRAASAGDTAFSRISAGLIGVGTGAAGSFAGGLKLTTLTLDGLAITKGYTVAGLPAGVTGAICHVTDQLTAVAAKGVAPTGGGAINCVVYYNGAAWVGI